MAVRTVGVGTTAVLACGVLAACASSPGVTKAGGVPPPVTLRIGTDDPPGRRAADQIEDLARRVAELSNGRVTIEPVYQAAGDTRGDDWDQKVARLVVDGTLDMGLVPARAWDTEGVTSLRALNAPMLVTSNALTAKIVDGDVADTMLGGLDAVGVHGLALFPESMRFVLSFDEPMLSAGDFDGALVRAPASATTYAALEALGATPGDVAMSDDAIGNGLVDAAESEFGLAHTFPRPPAYATGNLPLWPKVNSLVINSSRFEALPTDVKAVLDEAAAQTREWSVATMPDPVDEGAAFCEAGGTVVTAAPGEVDSIRDAEAPLLEELDADPTTRGVIAAITELARSTHAEPSSAGPCTPPARSSASPSAAGRDEPKAGEYAAFPAGSYRAVISAESLAAAGVPADDVANHAGVWTLTFRGGNLTIHDVNDVSGNVSDDTGVYCANATRISIGISQFARGTDVTCGNFWTADWSASGDQVRFTGVRTHVDPDPLGSTIFGSVPFSRVE